jgi:hypothetical protein
MRPCFPAYKTIFIFLVAGLFTAKAQDLSGLWEGYLDQTPDAMTRESYKSFFEQGLFTPNQVSHLLKLRLSQTNKDISGEYIIALAKDTNVNAVFGIKGHFDEPARNFFYKTVSKITEHSNYNMTFCYNKASLNYYIKDSMEYLEGNWKGWSDLIIPCADSYILVRRKLQKPKQKPAADTIKINPRDKKVAATEIKVVKQLNINASPVKLVLTDNNTEDGDTVSIMLNDQWIINRLRLKKKKQEFTVDLKEGENILKMYAENEGTIPPNTAKMILYCKDISYSMVLQSDAKKTEAIRVIYTKQ